MGMAASQARLLTITARLHDVEYKAQAIQNQKILLATRSEEIYNDYLKALDATNLTINNEKGEPIQANFNNLAGKNALRPDPEKGYALRDTTTDKIIVEANVADAYNKFQGGSAQDFAMSMVTGRDVSAGSLSQYEEYIYNTIKGKEDPDYDAQINALRESIGKVKNPGELTGDEKKNYDGMVRSYKNLMYKHHGGEIFQQYTGTSKESFNNEDFQYYSKLFEQIKIAGGCISIDDYNGPSGSAATNSEWLEESIKNGTIYLATVEEGEHGEINMMSSSPSMDSAVSYTKETSIDKTALAKAEAEYEHKSKQIDQKDKEYDMELSKLETERTALTTEYDSIKKVVQDNVERTFGIFS